MFFQKKLRKKKISSKEFGIVLFNFVQSISASFYNYSKAIDKKNLDKKELTILFLWLALSSLNNLGKKYKKTNHFLRCAYFDYRKQTEPSYYGLNNNLYNKYWGYEYIFENINKTKDGLYGVSVASSSNILKMNGSSKIKSFNHELAEHLIKSKKELDKILQNFKICIFKERLIEILIVIIAILWLFFILELY